MVLVIALSVMAQDDIRQDVPLRLYRCSLAGKSGKLVKGTQFEAYFIVENYRRNTSPAVEFKLELPDNVISVKENISVTIDPMDSKTTQAVYYNLVVNEAYGKRDIPLVVWMTDDRGILTPCYSVTLSIGQKMDVGRISPLTYRATESARVEVTSVVESVSDSKPTTERYQVIVSTRLNVRQRPTTQSKVIGYLSNNDYVEVHHIDGAWAEIDYNGNRAYVSSQHLKPVPPIKETIEEVVESADTTPLMEEVEVDDSPTVTLPQKVKSSKIKSIMISASIGYSSLYSFDASVSGKFAFGIEVGMQIHPSFYSSNLFAEVTVGFSHLGSANYEFPYFSICALPVGLNTQLLGKPVYAQVGFSLFFGGGDIQFYKHDHYFYYKAVPNLNYIVKFGLDLNTRWSMGLYYLHGITNVCLDLPIGLKNNTLQFFTTLHLGKQ